MKKQFSELKRLDFLKLVFLLILVMFTAFYTLPWIINNSLTKEYSGIDLHGYWYAGHFIRQGINSFAAILNDPNPNYWDPRVPGSGDPNLQVGAENLLQLPIHYIDGHVATKHPVAQTLIVVPAVTAPLNLVIGLLSWFSWSPARLIWLIFNLLIASIIPWIAIRLVNRYQLISFIDKLIFAFGFYSIYGLRQGSVVGQQTLICLLLLVLALFFRDRWIISGVLLGFGISKYSVGLPVFIYFLLNKRYRAILVSIIIQVLAILILIPLKLGSVLNTLTAYFRIIAVNYSQDGVHLLARFPENQTKTILFILILSVTILLIARQYLFPKLVRLEENIVSLNDLNLITLAIFLITYHRIHDMPFMIFFLLSVISVLIEIRNFTFSKMQLIFLSLVTTVIFFLLLFPTIPVQVVERIVGFSPPWATIEASTSLSLVLMFAISIWFQLKLPLDKEFNKLGSDIKFLKPQLQRFKR